MAKYLKIGVDESWTGTVYEPVETEGRYGAQFEYPLKDQEGKTGQVFTATKVFHPKLLPYVGQLVTISKVKKGEKTAYEVTAMGSLEEANSLRAPVESAPAVVEAPPRPPAPPKPPAPPPRTIPEPQNASQGLAIHEAAALYGACMAGATMELRLTLGEVGPKHLPQTNYMAAKMFDAILEHGDWRAEVAEWRSKRTVVPLEQTRVFPTEESAGLTALKKLAEKFRADPQLIVAYPQLVEETTVLPITPEEQRTLYTALRDVIEHHAKGGKDGDFPPEPDVPLVPPPDNRVPGHVVRIATLATEPGWPREEKIDFAAATVGREALQSTKELDSQQAMAVIQAMIEAKGLVVTSTIDTDPYEPEPLPF
jgi:hypothetical protein